MYFCTFAYLHISFIHIPCSFTRKEEKNENSFTEHWFNQQSTQSIVFHFEICLFCQLESYFPFRCCWNNWHYTRQRSRMCWLFASIFYSPSRYTRWAEQTRLHFSNHSDVLLVNRDRCGLVFSRTYSGDHMECEGSTVMRMWHRIISSIWTYFVKQGAPCWC